MTSPAELSSISTLVDELRARVAAAGDALVAADKEDVAAALFEADRSMRMATRRLDKAAKSL